MKLLSAMLLGAACFGAWSAFGGLEQSAPERVTILFTADLQGNLEPCHCGGEGLNGGMVRFGGRLDERRKSNPNTVWIEAGNFIAPLTTSGELKSEAMAEVFRLLQCDFIGLGPRDFTFGSKLLASQFEEAQPPVAVYSANLTEEGKSAPYPPGKLLELPCGLKLAVCSIQSQYTNFKLHARLREEGRQFVAVEAGEVAKEYFAKAPTGVYKLLLAQVTRAELESICLKLAGKVDLILSGEMGRRTTDYEMINGVQVIFGLDKPRGYVEVTLNKVGDWWKPTSEVVILRPGGPEHPGVEAIFRNYTEKLAKLIAAIPLPESKVAIKLGGARYTGSDACKSCHSEAYKVWAGSAHAKALESLRKTNQHIDPECLPCHTVGYKKAGGYTSESGTPGLANVGCESCHGAGSQHLKEPASFKMPTSLQKCEECHTKEHSNFEPVTFWEKVKH